MKRSILFWTPLLLSCLSACGGLSQSNSDVLPRGATAAPLPNFTMREPMGDTARSPAAPLIAGPSYRLYVANAGDNSIAVYNTNASGNTAPIATIIGSNTQLNDPGQLSEDASGNLYVANIGTSSILVFSHGANGNVAPVQAISGPLTGLSGGLWTATADQKTGKIFAVAQEADAEGGHSDLLRFPLNATGDEAPLATSPGVDSAVQLASDSTGKKLIYASLGVCCHLYFEGVYTTEKFPNGGPFSGTDIYNFGPGGIADDPTTKTFLVSAYDGVNRGIFRFEENTTGFGAFAAGNPPPPSYTPGVVSLITTSCGGQLALGYGRNIYMAQSASSGCASDAVYVYEHDASGDATPLRVLTGSATQLDEPNGIYEGK